MSPSTSSSPDAGWQRFAAARAIGDVLDGTVVRVMPFGSFVEIDDAVHGFVFQQELIVGANVRVRVAEIDPDKHRVRLTTE